MQYIDKKYINILSNYLTLFSDNGNEVYNFRCPYCGDSKKNKHKKRGYIVYDKSKQCYFYKCWNCGTVRNLQTFIKEQSGALYEEYRKEKFKSNFTKKPKPEPNFKTHVKFNNDIGTKLLKQFKKVTNNELALKYCNGRQLPVTKLNTLYYVDDITKLTTKLEKYKNKKFMPHNAIAIPFIQNSIVTHIQLRLLNNENFKYITLEIVDNAEKIYGLNFVDKNKTVYVFEGPFDSMFCNGVALAQGALHKKIPFLDKTFKDYVFVYDKDFIYNKEILKSLQYVINKNKKVILYDKTILQENVKDLNDMVKTGMITNVEKYFSENVYKALSAKMYLNKIKQINKHKNSNFTEVTI